MEDVKETDRRVLGAIITAERIPTRRELAGMVGKNLRSVQESVDRLEAGGYIARRPRAARGLEVISLP